MLLDHLTGEHYAPPSAFSLSDTHVHLSHWYDLLPMLLFGYTVMIFLGRQIIPRNSTHISIHRSSVWQQN